MKIFNNKYSLLASVAGLIVIADQITKALILKSMPLYQSVPVIPELFNITHIQNPGGAFGFLANQSENLRTIVFLVISSHALP